MTSSDLQGETRMTERWYSVDEIAAHLGIGRETVYRWIEQRGLPAHRIGKFWKLKVSEVDEWVRSGGASDVSNSTTNGEREEQ